MYMYVYIYIYIYTHVFLFVNVTKYQLNDDTLKFSYISILTNLLLTDNEPKSVKTTLYN